MKPKTLAQLVLEIIPLLGTTWVDNYEAKRDWINSAQKALEAIENPQPAPVEAATETIVIDVDLQERAKTSPIPHHLLAPTPPPARIDFEHPTNQITACTCETFGGATDEWTCPVCEGGRF